jgi:hypothetical protein
VPEGVSAHQLFALHRKEHAIAHITLRGSLADAWAWARPHIEAWREVQGDTRLRILRDGEVLARDQDAALDQIDAAWPGSTTPYQIAGTSFVFGTFAHAPWRMDPREQLVVQLVLSAYDRDCEHGDNLARLEAICDDAIASGTAYSALVSQQQYAPNDKTSWEDMMLRDDDPVKLASWHEAHVRGIDKRIWLSADQAAQIDRAAVSEHVTVTDLGRGLRLQMSDDRTRRELEPLIALLGSLVPTQAQAQRWDARRDEHTAGASAV